MHLLAVDFGAGRGGGGYVVGFFLGVGGFEVGMLQYSVVLDG